MFQSLKHMCLSFHYDSIHTFSLRYLFLSTRAAGSLLNPFLDSRISSSGLDLCLLPPLLHWTKSSLAHRGWCWISWAFWLKLGETSITTVPWRTIPVFDTSLECWPAFPPHWLSQEGCAACGMEFHRGNWPVVKSCSCSQNLAPPHNG